MKYLCEGCERLVEGARFWLDDSGELVLTCARCGAETRARSSAVEPRPAAASSPLSPVPGPPPPTGPSPASAARLVPLHAVPPPTFGGEDPFAVPQDRCPKCVAPRPEGAAICRQCGLAFVNFVALEHQPPAELQESWKALAARWDDLGAHDRVMASATARGELAALGRLYRIRLARQPLDPIAQRGRDEVLRLASSTSPLVPERPLGPPDPSSASWKALLWVSLLVLASLAVWMVSQLDLAALKP